MRIDVEALRKTKDQVKRIGYEVEILATIKRFMNLEYRLKFKQVLSNIDRKGIALEDSFKSRTYKRMRLLMSVWDFYREETKVFKKEREERLNFLHSTGVYFGLGAINNELKYNGKV